MVLKCHGYKSVEEAESLAGKITALNGGCVKYEGKMIPVKLRIGISMIPGGGLSYKEVLDRVHNAIEKVRQDGVPVGVMEDM